MPTLFLDPGQFSHWLLIEEPVDEGDGQGGFTREWRETAATWGMIVPLSARMREVARQTDERTTHHITVRWRDDIRSGLRFRKGERLFRIRTAYDPDETGRFLLCRCEEQGR